MERYAQGTPIRANKYGDNNDRTIPSHWIAQVHLFDTHPSILLDIITQMRQKEDNNPENQHRMRDNAERAGSILAYDYSQRLCYENKIIETGNNTNALGYSIQQMPIIVGIARAGIPLAQGAARMLYGDESRFYIGNASRLEGKKDPITHAMHVEVGEDNCPSLEGEYLTVWDTMLASGSSAIDVISNLKKKHGTPKTINMFSVIAAPEGIERMLTAHPGIKIHTAALDEKLNDDGYILPGLGDAGDRMYGQKHSK